MATRSELVKFRVSEVELALFKVCAGRQGMSLSDWLRSLANAEVNELPVGTPAAEEPASSPPSGTPSPAVTEPSSPPALVAPQAPSPKSSGSPSTVLTGTAKAVYASERPRAKKARTGFCVHRRRVDEFCPRCD